MLNQKINKKIFDKDVEQVPTRKGFGQGLLKAGEVYKHVVGLCSDLTESTQMHLFKNKFPNRFIEIGVAEQNLASVASGLSAMGKLPFISSYAMFSPGRNWEQIRTTICYNNRPVVIVGSHSGVSVGPDGGTHQAIEDIALTRVIPNMIVISPCDYLEAYKATLVSVKAGKPVYIRLTREKTPVITDVETPFAIGKASLFYGREGQKADVGVVATGHLVYKALKVAKSLEKENVTVKVLNLSTIKPLDENSLLDLAKTTGAFVTVEEHQVHGGMGSAVSEWASANFPIPIEFIGIKDQFGQSGKPEELLEYYQIGESHIKEAALKVLKRK
jgi:transketolase